MNHNLTVVSQGGMYFFMVFYKIINYGGINLKCFTL